MRLKMRSTEDLVAAFDRDPASVYDMTHDELCILSGEVGDNELIVDAILAVGGGSDADRAAALGMTLEEYLSYP
jgi:alcohol dehydrogenase class IV